MGFKNDLLAGLTLAPGMCNPYISPDVCVSSVSALAVQHRRWLSTLASFCKSEPWGEIKSGFHNGPIKHRTDFTGQNFTSEQASKQKPLMSSSILLQPLWMGTLGSLGLVTPACWQHTALPVQLVVVESLWVVPSHSVTSSVIPG